MQTKGGSNGWHCRVPARWLKWLVPAAKELARFRQEMAPMLGTATARLVINYADNVFGIDPQYAAGWAAQSARHSPISPSSRRAPDAGSSLHDSTVASRAPHRRILATSAPCEPGTESSRRLVWSQQVSRTLVAHFERAYGHAAHEPRTRTVPATESACCSKPVGGAGSAAAARLWQSTS